MTDQLKLKIVMIFSMLFILLNTFFISREQYWFMISPVILLVVLTSFLALDIVILLIVFFTPLSIILQESDFGAAISVPTEPLLFGVMIIYILRLSYEGKVDKRLFYHPVTIAILINLTWIFISCLTSTLPSVSWKFLLSRISIGFVLLFFS